MDHVKNPPHPPRRSAGWSAAFPGEVRPWRATPSGRGYMQTPTHLPKRVSGFSLRVLKASLRVVCFCGSEWQERAHSRDGCWVFVQDSGIPDRHSQGPGSDPVQVVAPFPKSLPTPPLQWSCASFPNTGAALYRSVAVVFYFPFGLFFLRVSPSVSVSPSLSFCVGRG